MMGKARGGPTTSRGRVYATNARTIAGGMRFSNRRAAFIAYGVCTYSTHESRLD